MDQLFFSLCFLLQTQSHLPSDACNSAFTASYINSDFKREVDEVKQYYDKKANRFLAENKGLFYSGFAVGTAYNTYQTKTFQVVMPIEPFVNQFSMNLKEHSQDYSLVWKWNF